MNHVVSALILFALGAWIASGTHSGYSRGAMPFVWLGGVNPLVFDRIRSPVWYWAALAINVALGAAAALTAILLLAIR